MHERYDGARMFGGGGRLGSRTMLVRVVLAFSVLCILILPSSATEAKWTLAIGEGGHESAASETEGALQAAGVTVEVQRELPNSAMAGEQFTVNVTFIAPADGFHAIGLTDVIPAGWTGSVDEAWTEPQAILARMPEPEEAVYIWMGPFGEGVEFTAVYKVTVPADVMPGDYIFGGSLEYYVEPFPAPSYWATPVGDTQVQVVDSATATTGSITGAIQEVDGRILPGASVVLYRDGEAIANSVSDQDGNYAVVVPGFADYEVVISKAGFRNETLCISVTEPTAYQLDFAGYHGLIPNAPCRLYVLACVDLWQLDDPSLQLDTERLLDVISAYKYPMG